MILGIGTDVVQIPRIEALINKFGDKFLSRILSDDEKKIYYQKACKAFCARRFAGKEAVLKALGLGIGRPLRLNDITIANDELGVPKVSIQNYDRDILMHISLSDDYPIATAFAIATRVKKSNKEVL